MSADISTGSGFVPPPGSTPVRKRLLREAVAMIDGGMKMNDAIYEIYDEYVGEPWRDANPDDLDRNFEAIEKGIRRLTKARNESRISVPLSLSR